MQATVAKNLDEDAPESQRLVRFAKKRVASICGVMSAGPIKLCEPTNYGNFMNLEYDAPDDFKYLEAYRNFSEEEIEYLNQYVLDTFLFDKQKIWDLTERGQVLINISRHVCFLYVNEQVLHQPLVYFE